MRKLLLIFAFLGLMSLTLAQTIVYGDKVNYVGTSASKLGPILKFNNIPGEKGNNTSLMLPSKPLVYNRIVYFPVETTWLENKIRCATTTIYALDMQKGVIRDSLVLQSEGGVHKYRHLLVNDSLMLIGASNSELKIYNLDANLKILKETKWRGKHDYVRAADIIDHKLCILTGKLASGSFNLIRLSPDNLALLDEQEFDEDFSKIQIQDHFIWGFTAQDDQIYYHKYDILSPKTIPVTGSINIKVPKTGVSQPFQAQVSNGIVYIGYSELKKEGGFQSCLYAYNGQTGNLMKNTYDGTLSFTVMDKNDKTYLCRTNLFHQKEVLMVSELKPDLQEINEKTCFFFSDYNTPAHLLPYTDTSVLLCGGFQFNSGREEKGLYGDDSIRMPIMIPKVFATVLNLR